MKPTLLVLAAGMGSRYGGLKQIDPVGPSGETIIDYSVYDALRAGFGKIVFVIRRDIEKAFREAVGNRFESRMAVSYAFQELDLLPSGFRPPTGRTKPWGTGHAILIAEPVIQEPFAVINGDDFYGKESFALMAGCLNGISSPASQDYCMVGFVLRKTLSEFGSVARGVCEIGADGWLRKVREYTGLEKDGMGALQKESSGEIHRFTGDEMVSMNLWGFSPSIFDHLRSQMIEFLRERGGEEKSEFFIPTVVNRLIQEGKSRARVLPTPERWYGVTYVDDRKVVAEGVQKLISEEKYPSKLWS